MLKRSRDQIDDTDEWTRPLTRRRILGGRFGKKLLDQIARFPVEIMERIVSHMNPSNWTRLWVWTPDQTWVCGPWNQQSWNVGVWQVPYWGVSQSFVASLTDPEGED